jgi:alkylated DNA repair dioxygenase AlkB
MNALLLPPVHFEADFLSDPEGLFEHLVQTVQWDERMRARKTASFGVSYDYSQMHYDTRPMPPELQAVAHLVKQRIGFEPNNCLLNYYEDGRSSMGFHSDSTAELTPGAGVAIVSLGSEREIVFRSKTDRKSELRYALPKGSLLYMTNEVQDSWLHAIPKASGVGPRISLTFRSVVK